MKMPLVILVALVLVLHGVEAKPVPKNLPKQPSDNERLQGNWKMAALEQRGVKIDVELFPPLAIKGDQWRQLNLMLQGIPSLITFDVDPTKSPKTIDLIYDRGLVSRGIYRIEGDVFTVCRTVGRNVERPTEFKTSDDGGILVVWKRDRK